MTNWKTKGIAKILHGRVSGEKKQVDVTGLEEKKAADLFLGLL